MVLYLQHFIVKTTLSFVRKTTFFFQCANENTNRIICYTDADWANDSSDRKSTSGFIITLNNFPIHWSSKKQNLVALSSTEAELISLVEAVKEVNYITKLLIDMEEEIKHVPKIYEVIKVPSK